MRDTANTSQEGPAPEYLKDTKGNGQCGMGHDPVAKNDPGLGLGLSNLISMAFCVKLGI